VDPPGDLLYGRDRGDPPKPRGRFARLRARKHFWRSPDGLGGLASALHHG